jgi:N-methylhydantoinase B
MVPIAFELFKNAIFSIADEMALTVFRTTYSGVLKDNMDYSTGFASAEGLRIAPLKPTKRARSNR